MDQEKLREYAFDIHKATTDLNSAIRRAAAQGLVIEHDYQQCGTIGWPAEYPQFTIKTLLIIDPHKTEGGQ